MPEFVKIFISAVLGAAIALIGRELLEWYRRPRLIIDFERTKNECPSIQDYNDTIMGENSGSFRIAFLRLNVFNKGKTAAYNCEAKMDLIATRPKNKYRKSLHWSKYEPAIYKSLDQIYSPININHDDNETVDVLRLNYVHTDSNPPKQVPNSCIETYSPGVLLLDSKVDFYAKVTIYARNTTSNPFYFKVNWDGTVTGFWKAFTKIRNIPIEHSPDGLVPG